MIEFYPTAKACNHKLVDMLFPLYITHYVLDKTT